jgi:hypothetical protein
MTMIMVRLRQNQRQRRGLSILYVVVMMFLLIGFVAFAVDLGRMRLARSQLQTAADASARAGASGLPFIVKGNANPPFDRAKLCAEKNICLSDAVSLNATADVQLGIWDPTKREYTALNSAFWQDADAITVTTRRISARSNPIKLYFAGILGFPAHSIETTAIAYVKGNPKLGYGVIGLNGITSNGNKATIDSYDGSGGKTYSPATKASNGNVASNGNIDLGNGDISGDARAGGDVIKGPNANVTGWQAPLDQTLVFPPITSIPSGATVLKPNKNQKTVMLQGGTASNPKVYQYTQSQPFKFDIAATGYSELYVQAELDLGNATVAGLLGAAIDPLKIKIFVVGNHDVTIGGNPKQYMELYAPQSNITIKGVSVFYGSMVGKTVNFQGTSDIHYDQSDLYGTKLPGYQIHLVK